MPALKDYPDKRECHDKKNVEMSGKMYGAGVCSFSAEGA